MNSPKLLFLVTEDWYFCSHRLPLAIAAKEAGYDVSVITRVRNDGDRIRSAHIRLIPYENNRHSLNPLSLIRDIVRLVTIYRKEQPDIVHHVALKPVIIGSVAARLAGVKLTVNALAGLGWMYSSNNRRAAWLGVAVRHLLASVLARSRIIVQNPDDRTWLLDLGISDESITLIRGSGVDIRQFYPKAAMPVVPVVILASRMLWEKGVGEFVEAAAEVKRRGTTARFVLVGAPDLGNPGSVPDKQLRDWAADGVVEWWGKRDDMTDVLAQAQIACLPSYYGEGVPKFLLEAAAAGLPIVTTDSPGCRETVVQNVNGLAVPPRDPSALADALNALLHDSGRRAEMGRNSRKLAETEFSIDRVTSETLALYRKSFL
ncbi:MAG: glycosyltransferase family 4 protein [Steroidobacteraceae bacterium]